ncbi:MAG TPA: purine-binding chemotaxis protein CheW [Thermodesulfobacteriaceae bacterium]|nr:purine-binding chemotaxis protein CheW [Thermodesulfobacteriaceae bacterium]
METSMKEPNSLSGKYLSLTLAEEVYGLAILKVREIISLLDITAVPQTPLFVKGVINLRGKVIPIVDLRLRFGMPEKQYDDLTCIVVVETDLTDVQAQVGLIVDTVSDVLNITAEQIETAPACGTGLDTDYILGIGKVKEQIIILLDIDRVLKDEDWFRQQQQAEEDHESMAA